MILGQSKTVDSCADPIRVTYVFLTRSTGLLGRAGSNGPHTGRLLDPCNLARLIALVFPSLYLILTGYGCLYVHFTEHFRDFVTTWPTETMNAYKASVCMACISPQHRRRLISYELPMLGTFHQPVRLYTYYGSGATRGSQWHQPTWHTFR